MMFSRVNELPEHKRRSAEYGAAAAFAVVVAVVAFSFPAIGILEWRLADFWTGLSYDKRVSPTVAVVGVDEALFEQYKWPLEKDMYGDLIDYLDDMGASAIVFDILFADNLYDCGRSDSIFTLALESVPDVVLSYQAFIGPAGIRIADTVSSIPVRYSVGAGSIPALPVVRVLLPYRQLADKAGALGFENLATPAFDGIDRKMPTILNSGSRLFPSLALASVMTAEKQRTVLRNAKEEKLQVGSHQIVVDRVGNVLVNFKDSIPVYPLSDVKESHRSYLSGKEPALGERQFKNKIVFVGNTAPSLGDFGINPLSHRDVTGRSPNVLMHAYTAETILSNAAIKPLGRSGAILYLVVLALLVWLAFTFLPFMAALPVSMAVVAAGYGFGQWQYLGCRYLPVLEAMSGAVLSIICCSLVVYWEKDRNRRFLYNTFKLYLSPALIEDMNKKGYVPELGGAEAAGTAFFTDLEGFTGVSEQLDAHAMVGFLNEYFTKMTTILLECNGTLDKFVGDAIVAFFGAPNPSARHAADACAAAVRMQEALAELRARWAKQSDLPEDVKNLKMRIGINSGKFITGNIGCDLRMNYTMMGDAVNLAARIESIIKQYGAYTVVAEDTYQQANAGMLFRKLDVIRVKGKMQATQIYQLLGKRREDDRKVDQLIAVYEEGLIRYLAGDFSGAAALFGTSLAFERYPKLKNPSSVMLERCRTLQAAPPETWSGVFGYSEK
jgi:adenylate cyclase